MIWFIFIMWIILSVYFVPTIIAYANNHKNAGAILALNLLTGWTFFGWVWALVRALSK